MLPGQPTGPLLGRRAGLRVLHPRDPEEQGQADAGDDAAPELPAADRDGNPRITGSHVDMGAYEGPYAGLAMPWINHLLLMD